MSSGCVVSVLLEVILSKQRLIHYPCNRIEAATKCIAWEERTECLFSDTIRSAITIDWQNQRREELSVFEISDRCGGYSSWISESFVEVIKSRDR